MLSGTALFCTRYNSYHVAEVAKADTARCTHIMELATHKTAYSALDSEWSACALPRATGMLDTPHVSGHALTRHMCPDTQVDIPMCPIRSF